VGAARAERIRGEITELRRAVQSEVAAAWEAYGLRLKAADALQATVAALDDNDALARRSYEVGQIGLAELLLIRRETVEARAALLQRQVEAGQARVELQAKAGVIQ
jgi:cobalt-zinc-cadmium efflux system outer membrane protein